MRKLLPCPLIYVKEIENWLNKMAQEGKHLVKLNHVFAVFEEGESADTQYAVVMHEEVRTANDAKEANKLLSRTAKKQKVFERMDAYEYMGWKLIVTNINSYSNEIVPSLKSCVDGTLSKRKVYSVYKSNITTDKHMRDIWNNKCIEKNTNRLILNFASLALMALSIVTSLYGFTITTSTNTPFPDNFFYEILRVMAVCIPLLVFGYWAFKYTRLHRVYKGKKDTYRPPFKFAPIVSLIIILASIPAIIFIRPVEYRTKWDSIYFGDIDNLVNLEVMEGEYANELPNEMLDDYYEGYFNSILFMPLHYEIKEEIILDDGQRIWYSVEYTKSSFKGPINLFTRRGLKYHTYGNEDEVTYIDSSYFNSASYIYSTFSIQDESPIVFMYLIRDYDYYRIWYSGNRTPQEIAENIENYLTAANQ